MWEFLQANSSLILFGLFVVVMLFMHGGMGHGAGHGGHNRTPSGSDEEQTQCGANAPEPDRRLARERPAGHRGH